MELDPKSSKLINVKNNQLQYRIHFECNIEFQLQNKCI